MAVEQVQYGTITVSTGYAACGSAITTPGVYQLFVDLSPLMETATFHDILHIFLQEKARSGDTERFVWHDSFTGYGSGKGFVSNPVLIMNSATFYLQSSDSIVDMTYGIRRIVP
jgi:hypothetical protein